VQVEKKVWPWPEEKGGGEREVARWERTIGPPTDMLHESCRSDELSLELSRRSSGHL